MVITIDNSRLSIIHIGKTTTTPHYNFDKVHLLEVNRVPDMKETLVSVA